MPTKVKIHLIKALILPLLDYPPIPIHTLSKTQLRKLQLTHNKALRFATNQRYPYTMNTREIHEYTNTEPINIRVSPSRAPAPFRYTLNTSMTTWRD